MLGRSPGIELPPEISKPSQPAAHRPQATDILAAFYVTRYPMSQSLLVFSSLRSPIPCNQEIPPKPVTAVNAQPDRRRDEQRGPRKA